MAKFGSQDSIYEEIEKKLKLKDHKKKKVKSHIADALIAETAIKNNLLLISEDSNLCNVVRDISKNYYSVIKLKEFKSI